MLGAISTGTEVLDRLIEGYEQDIITTIYGPAGSGKTNLCLVAAINAIKSKKKVIYIDTEGGFSVARLKQLTSDYKTILDEILLLKPIDFVEQHNILKRLKGMVGEVGLIIVDSIGMLYRLEVGKSNDIYSVNKELVQQVSYLLGIARKNNIPVLVTNQVYADFENKDSVKIVGGDILRYSSKCLIELQKFKTRRKAILKKHRSLPENKEVVFEIKETGLFEVKE